jgi:hypothetical protein
VFVKVVDVTQDLRMMTLAVICDLWWWWWWQQLMTPRGPDHKWGKKSLSPTAA